MSNHHVDCAGGLRLGSATRKLVFLALCDDASRTSGLAMPGLEKVMEWAECSKSQAMAHMKRHQIVTRWETCIDGGTI